MPQEDEFMNGLTAFVDAIIEHGEKARALHYLEEDQELPSAEVLGEGFLQDWTA